MGDRRRDRSDKPVTFGELLDAHQLDILRYLLRLCRRAPDAEDLFQETFLRAFRAFGRLDGRSNVRAWLYRIATNVFLNHCRTVTRRGEVALTERMAGVAACPADGARVDGTALRLALLGLPARQRVAFVQRRLHGASYQAVGAVLGCSAGTARAHVYRASRALRRVLTDRGGDHDV